MTYKLREDLRFSESISSLSNAYFSNFDRIEGSDRSRLQGLGIQLNGSTDCLFFIESGITKFSRLIIKNDGHGSHFVFGGGPGVVPCNVVIRLLGSNINVLMPAIKSPFNFENVFLRSDDQTLLIGLGTTSVGTTIGLEGRGKTLLVGDDCMFSSDINIRNHDMHTIFKVDDGAILNSEPDNMVIERHVWIGYRTFVLRSPVIGAGSVVGACSLLNKSVPSLSLFAGTPAKQLRKGISWSRAVKKVGHVDLELARNYLIENQ